MNSDPIMITGLGRSGTSILGEIFQKHPATSYRFEPFSGDANRIGSIKAAPPDRVLVCKDPTLFLFFAEALERWPSCRFVIIERDLRDVACSVASAMKAGKISKRSTWLAERRGVPHSVREEVAHLPTRAMILAVGKYLRDTYIQGIQGEGVFRVQFEELLTDTDLVVRRLFEDLALSWDNQVKEFLPNVADRVSVHVNKNSSNLFVNDHLTRIGRWLSEFTEEESTIAERLMRGI